MRDDLDLIERPSAAELEANRAEIVAFREANPTLTRTGLAVAFVEKRGSATSAELSVLLDLRADQYPSVELSSAVQNGRLVRDGKVWTLGPNVVAYERRKADKPDALQSGAELGRVEAPATPKFAEQNAEQPLRNLRQALREPVPVSVPQWRFAVWSDGQVEIERNGENVLSLPRDVARDLSKFLLGAL
jgi:hypothetical protein